METINTNSIYKDITEEVNRTNSYAKLVPGQTIVEIPSFELECGETLYNFPVAYKTWGRLNKDRDNVLVICHALTGSSDVQDWWGPLLGTGKTFDPSKFFIICINFLGSPYGSCSPLSIDKSTNKPYGPSYPLVTVKDDLGIQRLILDSLGVKSVACAIGGSMGGMMVLEYSATYNKTGYVKSIIAIATSARSSAWCISWNEAQRQCIFSDPAYNEGDYYDSDLKPNSGLGAARMSALLTYRSRNSFENRFGRKLPNVPQEPEIIYPRTKDEENWLLHNEGAKNNGGSAVSNPHKLQTYFTAQSYLRYQGSKFVNRFDANCYISITRKLDTHDIARGRVGETSEDPLPKLLQTLQLPHLIIGIQSDGLFTFSEQQLLDKYLPNSQLKRLDSQEGHDAFLLDFEIVNNYCLEFLKVEIPEFYNDSGKYEVFENWKDFVKDIDNGGNSVFGEAEKNITNW